MKKTLSALSLLLLVAACGKSDPTTSYPVVTTGPNHPDYYPYPAGGNIPAQYSTGAAVYPQQAGIPAGTYAQGVVPYPSGAAYPPGFNPQGAPIDQRAIAQGPGALPGLTDPRFAHLYGQQGQQGQAAQQGCRPGDQVVEISPDPGRGLPVPPGARCQDNNSPMSMVYDCQNPQTGESYEAKGLGCRR